MVWREGGRVVKYISLFSGIEAASVAWEPLGWEPVAFSEVDPFCCALLAKRFPGVPNLGDIRDVEWSSYRGAVDLIVGGSPCQSFSIAGGRESLDGESRLMYEYIRACDEVRPTWIVWENVPGVLSVRDNAFGQLLQELQNIGYVSLAWRVLDAQFFGVAQRRRRVFLVGSTRAGGAAPAVLFESESVRGNTKTSRQKREELAASCTSRARASGEYVLATTQANAELTQDMAPTLNCHHEQPTLVAFNPEQITSPTNRSNPKPGDPCHTLASSNYAPVVCISSDTANAAIESDLAGTLHVGGGTPYLVMEKTSSEHYRQETTRESGASMCRKERLYAKELRLEGEGGA